MSAQAEARRVPVLMYHRIDARVSGGEKRYCVSARQFANQLEWLSEHGYRPCTVAAFADWFHGRAVLPQRSVLITFDDGFSELHEHALPLLGARSWPSTVFLVSGLIGQSDEWGRREFGASAPHSLLDRHQVEEMMRHGFEFQSHSRTHVDLTSLSDADLNEQIRGSRHELEDILGTAVEHFAYPYGRFDERVSGVVQASGYEMAFSVNPGFNRPGDERYAVRRLDVTGHDSRANFGRKVALGTNDGSWTQHVRYLGRRIVARVGPSR